MPNSKDSVIHLTKCFSESGAIRLKPMFGEYAVYYKEKLVALFCNDHLYLKTTPPGREALGDTVELPPYPGAKPHLIVPDHKLDDHSWLSELIRATAVALPEKQKPTKKRILR